MATLTAQVEAETAANAELRARHEDEKEAAVIDGLRLASVEVRAAYDRQAEKHEKELNVLKEKNEALQDKNDKLEQQSSSSSSSSSSSREKRGRSQDDDDDDDQGGQLKRGRDEHVVSKHTNWEERSAAYAKMYNDDKDMIEQRVEEMTELLEQCSLSKGENETCLKFYGRVRQFVLWNPKLPGNVPCVHCNRAWGVAGGWLREWDHYPVTKKVLLDAGFTVDRVGNFKLVLINASGEINVENLRKLMVQISYCQPLCGDCHRVKTETCGDAHPIR